MKTNRKNMSAVILSALLSASALAGCSGASGVQETTLQETAVQETAAEETHTPETSAEEAAAPESSVQEKESEKQTEEAAEPHAEPAAKYEDNFEVDGAAAKEFAEKIQKATADKDLEALAELTSFPVYVGLPDVGVVETKEDFLAIGADTLFTDELTASVAAADIDSFQPSMAGFSISDGGSANINFGVTDGVLAVNGINY